VLEADQRWIAAFNREDVATILAIYAPDVVVMPPDRADLHGREAVGRWLAGFFLEQAAKQILVHDEVVAHGDLAFLRGSFELQLRSRKTDTTSRVRGKHLVLWRRDDDDRWLAIRDIWNVEP
jgi:ketosteroid isomerase-like protein